MKETKIVIDGVAFDKCPYDGKCAREDIECPKDHFQVGNKCFAPYHERVLRILFEIPGYDDFTCDESITLPKGTIVYIDGKVI